MLVATFLSRPGGAYCFEMVVHAGHYRTFADTVTELCAHLVEGYAPGSPCISGSPLPQLVLTQAGDVELIERADDQVGVGGRQ